MKKVYVEPTLQIIELVANDLICTSTTGDFGPGGGLGNGGDI